MPIPILLPPIRLVGEAQVEQNQLFQLLLDGGALFVAGLFGQFCCFDAITVACCHPRSYPDMFFDVSSKTCVRGKTFRQANPDKTSQRGGWSDQPFTYSIIPSGLVSSG
jgi:hypothetical protein